MAYGQTKYYRLEVSTAFGCFASSESFRVYGNKPPELSIASSGTTYSTSNPIYLSGYFYEPDFYSTSFDKVERINLFTSVGNIADASFTKQQTGTSGTWEYLWNTPHDGISIISATAYDMFGQTKTVSAGLPSTVYQGPVITLTNPPTSGTYSFQNQVITLSASVVSSYPFTNTNFTMYKGSSVINLGSAVISGSNWTKTFNLSSALSAVNNEGGIYKVIASGTDNNGSPGISIANDLSANSLPIFNLTNPVGPACHNGSIDVVASIIDDNNVCLVKILSGSTTLTSAYSTNGIFNWTWNNPNPGIHSLSAIVYDSVTSSDYSLTNFVISAGRTPTISLASSFVNGKKNAVVDENIYITSSGNVLLSATVVSSETTITDFWFSDSFGNKNTLISANTISNSAYIPFNENGQKYVLIETRTVGGCSKSILLNFYCFKPEVELIDFNNCGTSLRINGTVNFDGVSGTNGIVDNTFVCSLYASATFIDNIVLTQVGSQYSFDYTWLTPIDGVSALEFRFTNQYGSFSDIKQISKIITGNITNTLTPVSYITNNGSFFVVSGTTITISSTTNVSDVKEYQLIAENEQYVTIIYSTDGVFNIFPINNKIHNIRSKITTSGGCEVYSPYISIMKINGLSKIVSVSNASCNSTSANVTGYISPLTTGYASSAIDVSSEVISATVLDNFGNVVQTISARNYQYGFDFDYIPVVGTSSLTLVTSSSIIGNYSDIKTFATTETTVSANVTTNTVGYYNILNPIALTISASSSNIKKVTYLVNDSIVGNSITTPFNSSYIPTQVGLNEINAIVESNNGCLYTTPKVSANITTTPVSMITSPANNSYIMSGATYDINALVSPSFYGVISAVDFYDQVDSFISSAAYVGGSVWKYTNSNTISGVRARVYDSIGLSGISPLVNINVVLPTTSFISASSPTYSANEEVVFEVSGTSPNTSAVIKEIYEVINGEYIYIGTVSGTSQTIPASVIGVGTHTIVSKTIDEFGAFSYSSPIIITITSTDIQTYPTIVYIGSDNIDLIEDYGNVITSNFKIYDTTFGILSATIAAVGGTITEINSSNGIFEYTVSVNVSSTGSVTISAANKLNNVASYTVNNYIFKCADSRDINLVNYIPNHLYFDESGKESEFVTLTSFFEKYLNTLYTNLDEPCSIGILEKTNRLRNLHDPDKMELDYIQYFANYLGYNVDVNRSELGGFVSNPNSSAYADGPDRDENGEDIFNEYKKKALRFVVRNLPNWYSIKTTRNSVKTLLLSFGLFGDLLEVYTNDYVNDWIINNIPPGTYVSTTMTTDRFPTPHMYVSIDLNNSSLESVYGSEQSLTSVYKSFEIIRPANVVFEGLVAKFNLPKNDIFVTARYQLEGNMRITNVIS